jgi:hypothetical protein
MKKLLLMLISLLATQAPANSFVREHTVYRELDPWIMALGTVIAGIALAAHHNSKAAILAARLPEQHERIRNAEAGKRRFEEEQRRQQAENQERLRQAAARRDFAAEQERQRLENAARIQRNAAIAPAPARIPEARVVQPAGRPAAQPVAPAQPAPPPQCPMCMENRPLVLMHQRVDGRGDEHRACEDCIFNHYSAAQQPGYVDANGNYVYRTNFNCCLCRNPIDNNIQNRMRNRYDDAHAAPVNPPQFNPFANPYNPNRAWPWN